MDEYQEVFGTEQEDAPPPPESGLEDAGGAPEEEDRGREEPAGGAEMEEEDAEELPDEPEGTDAGVRRQEAQARQAAEQAGRDKIYADIFAGQVNPFTGKPITTEAEYWAWKAERDRRNAAQQRLKAQQELARAGLPADTLRQMVSQEVENHPAVMQARQATMAAAMERADAMAEEF